MDILNDIKKFLSHSECPITREWLDEAMERYPYFNLPLLLYLKQHGTHGEDELLGRMAITSPDRKSLALVLGKSAQLFAGFYPPQEEPQAQDTESTIDRFLDSFGSSNPKEIEVLNNAIFNPTPDYADILAAEDRKEAGQAAEPQNLSHDDELINRFIAQSREKEKQAVAMPSQQHVEETEKAEIAHVPIEKPEVQDDSMLSESLAKMYISRRKYSKALEIIENINLKYPEKSIYFADQIRFLRKLVLNEKVKNKKN